MKPPDEKWFGARVYASGAALEVAEGMEDEYAVLIAEPVLFEVEYRFFVLERAVAAGSIYIRGGAIARSGGGSGPPIPPRPRRPPPSCKPCCATPRWTCPPRW